MTATFVVGDTREVTASLPDGSVDLILTSPPFLALRSYLPADHESKHLEIGSEANPAAFIDVLLQLTAEWRRILAPHGSICIELGDTYSGSGGAGGDYNADGLRDGHPTFDGSGRRVRQTRRESFVLNGVTPNTNIRKGDEWPLAKSLALVPELYRIGLAYGLNPLTGAPSPAGRWRVRNVVRWVRPNPPVGALGDKFRPATSDLVVACVAGDRWFDLDAVRTEIKFPESEGSSRAGGAKFKGTPGDGVSGGKETGNARYEISRSNAAGAPPLDWWQIVPGGFSGTTSTTRQVPCGPLDGGQRTTSPDCPIHADLPGQLPKALRDGRAETSATDTPRIGARHVQGQLGDSAPTDPHNAPATAPESSDSTTPPCAPAANQRGKGSSKTAPAPATSPLGTPSAGTPGRTEHTPTSPESDAHRPGTSASSISGPLSTAESDLGTPPRTADTASPDRSCTCSFTRSITESSSHYAVWPPALCERPIEAMCPRRVCRTCGKPSRRITGDVEYLKPSGKAHAFHGDGFEANESLANRRKITGHDNGNMTAVAPTVGWSSCGCPNTDELQLDGYHTGSGWRPGLVFDPFVGSGTTLVVSHGHSRDSIGADLDPRNAELAALRLGMFLQIQTQQKEETTHGIAQ